MTSAAKEMKSIYEKVISLLDKLPHLRDSDPKLIATIWLKELGGKEVVEKMNGMQLLHIFAENKQLTTAESIGRARRKAQENHLRLRGSKYLEKQTHQKEVKEFIHKTQY